VTDNRELETRTTETRPTIELEPVANLSRHRYSVGRASTEDERSQLVERVAVGRVTAPSPKPVWRVEHQDKTVIIRNESMQFELSTDDARKIAEAILRGR
jgi:hypothetical protein